MTEKRFIPWLTVLITLLCFGMFLWQYYLRASNHDELEIYSQLGAPSALKIFQGHYWGVFWNSFLHRAWPLLLLNTFAFLYFGSHIEKRTNFLTLFILGFLASTITSLIQLTLTDNAGIGMTGANYFFLSYIYGRSEKEASYKLAFVNAIIIIAIGILILFVSTNYMNLTNFGIESILAGIIFGFITGFLVGSRKKIASYSFVVITLIGLSTTLFYAPWSVDWNLSKAYDYYDSNDYVKAKYHYREVLRLEPKNSVSKQNLLIIRIEELSDEAFMVHEQKDYLEAHKLYNKILNLDPDNQWAKDQIDKLP